VARVTRSALTSLQGMAVVACQNVVEFGGTWLIVDRRGNAVR
jgi:hypothetical protein